VVWYMIGVILCLMCAYDFYKREEPGFIIVMTVLFAFVPMVNGLMIGMWVCSHI
jgi:hypothetical protein